MRVGAVSFVVAGTAACGPSPAFYYEDASEADYSYRTPPSSQGALPGRGHDTPPLEREPQTGEIIHEPAVTDTGIRISDPELAGHWTGVGQQSDGAQWKMELDITRTDDGPCAIVRYPDLGCGGYWSCVANDEDGGGFQAIEHITHGSNRCVDRVNVEVSLSDTGRLIFSADAGNILAGARLDKSR